MTVIKSVLAGATLLFGFVGSTQALVVNVLDQDRQPVQGYKWLIEEDNTHLITPGVHETICGPGVTNALCMGGETVYDNTLSVSLHHSHAPVVAKGETATSMATVTTTAAGAPLPPGRYFVSVLPYGDRSSCDGTYDVGGSPVTVIDGTETVTVYVQQNPIETAQISVKVFHDILPLNNAPDTPEIDPVNSNNPMLQTMQGFTVTLADQGGDIVSDSFGNPLGTTYVPNMLNGDCEPIVDQLGVGDLITPPGGELIIKNLIPGKFAVQVEPPRGKGWIQTTTIEGTKTIDAWVRPNEPEFFVEFGPPSWHVFTGFTREFNNLDGTGVATGTITGTITKAHLARPPSFLQFFSGGEPEGEAVGERCAVGLNQIGLAGISEAVYAGLCEDGSGDFTINGVPPGVYQLVTWDVNLLQIISFGTVTVPPEGGPVNAGDLLGRYPVPMWFGIHEHNVFSDDNRNGFREANEVGIPEQNVNLRFRDGTIYQAFPTDTDGFVPFQAIFPFFHWLTAEVDFARLQATGLTTVVDNGGPVTFDQWGAGKRTPQDQTGLEGGTTKYRTEKGVVLVEAFQVFAGQNVQFEWGKAPYDNDVNAVITDGTQADYFASTADWPTGVGDIDSCVDGAEVPAPCLAGVDGEYNANGGVSGIVFYATTRAENNPRFAAGEEWEPGIPNLQVSLYRDIWCGVSNEPALYGAPSNPSCLGASPGGGFGDGIPDDANGSGFTEFADVDNYPLNWAPDNCDGVQGVDCVPGPEDVDDGVSDGTGNGVFDMGDAIRVAWTDHWDANLPEECRDDPVPSPIEIHGVELPMTQCAEGMRTWNQVRPGVFDGGYAFGPGDPLLIPGTYIVSAATPPGYETLKEEDRNVDFGNIAIPVLLPPVCVGADHVVPQYFSFLTDENGVRLPGVEEFNEDNYAPFAGETRKLCNAKKVDLGTGQNAAADFFVFTDVPKAARGVGLMTDDLNNELSPRNPAFTEKYSPPWLPIAVFDYTGQEINRTYGDEFGAYNFMGPASYNVNPPSPSGIGPKMLQFCINHPGPIKNSAFDGNPGDNVDLDGDFEFITDPFFRTQYSTSCYQFNFDTGRTIYLDTPVIRQAAFVSALQQTLDCEAPDTDPVIRRVTTNSNWGPLVAAGQTLEIDSMGPELVPNPDYPGDIDGDGFPDDPSSAPQLIERDHGFGSTQGTGTVCVDDYCFGSVTWTDRRISVSVTAGDITAGLETGQLTVTRDNGTSTQVGITLTVDEDASTPNIVDEGVNNSAVVRVACNANGEFCAPGAIQDAINAADPNALILVEPGTYHELPIMYKRAKLQGAGVGATILWSSGVSFGSPFINPLTVWQENFALFTDGNDANGEIGLLDFQANGLDGDGPGIMVAPPENGPNSFGTLGAENLRTRARIDGFAITLADVGGGIYVNGNAHRLLISNNRLKGNSGNLAGAIRIGNGAAQLAEPVPDSPNVNIDIRHNDINQNGSFTAGGGIAIYTGADIYNISDNFICGNFARSGGGGISHRGLSDAGKIENNKIVFNEVFQGDMPGPNVGVGGGGGGIEVAGLGDGVELTDGSGNVVISGNLIQGNLAGAADGGGVSLLNINGTDVACDNGCPAEAFWHRIDVFNNMIVNNVAGFGGGGVALQDAVRVRIIHNTIANNASTATSTGAFQGGLGSATTPQPAGVVSRAHSLGLALIPNPNLGSYSLASGAGLPSVFRRNIVSGNRAFFYDSNIAPIDGPPLGPIDMDFWDLGVTGVTACLNPDESFLSFVTGNFDGCDYTGLLNSQNDPGFKSPYSYDSDNPTVALRNIRTAAAQDEGGNFVQVYFTPLAVTGDYHLAPTSPAINSFSSGVYPAFLLQRDFDGDVRPTSGTIPDTGADESTATVLRAKSRPGGAQRRSNQRGERQ